MTLPKRKPAIHMNDRTGLLFDAMTAHLKLLWAMAYNRKRWNSSAISALDRSGFRPPLTRSI